MKVCLPVLACIFMAASVWGAEGGRPVLAVGNLRNSAGIPENLHGALNDMFITALQKTGKFVIVERDRLQDLIKEQELAASGNLELSDESLSKLNKFAGAKYYVLGNVVAFQDETRESIYESFGVATTQHISRISFDIRISDTTTSKVLEAATVTRERKEVDAGTTTIVGEPKLDSGQLGTVVREAIDALTIKVVEAIFPIRVIEKEEGLVFLNRGEGGGLEKGQILSVYRLGRELKDPETGEILGATETKVGSVRITGIRPKFSQAEILEDAGVAPGNICRAE